METQLTEERPRYDVVGQVQTPVVSVEIRDTYVEQDADLLLAYPEVLLGSPLSSIPRPRDPNSRGADHYGEVGDVIFMPSDAPWRFRAGAGRFRTITTFYGPDIFAAVRGDEWHARALSQSRNIRNLSMSGVFGRLAAEVQSPGFASNVMVEGLGMCLIAELARSLNPPPAAAARARGLSEGQLKAIRDFIAATRGRQPTLSELSDLCGLGRRTFTRRFRASTGQSLGAWIADQKVAMAKQMLASGDMSIKQIAFELGFSTPSNFSVAFRRAVGAPPSAYALGRRE